MRKSLIKLSINFWMILIIIKNWNYNRALAIEKEDVVKQKQFRIKYTNMYARETHRIPNHCDSPIVNYPYLCSYFQASIIEFLSLNVWCFLDSVNIRDFLKKAKCMYIIQGICCHPLKSSFQKFFSRHHDLTF